MMKRYTWLFLILITNYGLGQDRNKATENVLSQAAIMGQAFVRGDYGTFVKYTYPGLVAMMGHDKMVEALQSSAENMKSRGMLVDNITFDPPSGIIKVNSQLQCTLPQHTTIKMANGKMITTSTLIAISKDGGKNWSFIDTSGKDIGSIRKVFPFLSNLLVIEPEPKPSFYPN